MEDKCALTNLREKIMELKVSSDLKGSFVDTKALKDLYTGSESPISSES